jgi:hypothetical protein
MRTVGLTDSQRVDLTKIWATQSNEIISDSTEGGTASSNAMHLQDHTIQFVARLTSFFLHGINVLHDRDANHNGCSSLLESFRSYFPALGTPSSDNIAAFSSSDALVPRLAQGRHLVTMDHTQFLSELDEYEGNQYINPTTGQKASFGSFLYHRPKYGLCVANSSVALTLMTMQRRSQLQSTNTLGNNLNLMQNQNQHQNQQSRLSRPRPHFIPPQSIVINVRFYNVYPSIEISDVKTDNAYKFITLRGRIIKVQSKRLRLLQSDVLCIKCGQQFEHMFIGGRYELPTRCNLVGTENGKKCPGQKFELLRRTAKYIDCQMLKLQEEDNATSAAGRTPRHLELEVTHDLVDVCHAGNCVRVVGVVHAVNSAVKAGGRKGKQATETSTYHLFMKANSILNTTAELHDKKNKGGDDGSRGLAFTEEQLNKITKVAHAGELMLMQSNLFPIS